MGIVYNMTYFRQSIKNTDALLVVTIDTGSSMSATKNGITLTPNMWVQNANSNLDCALFFIPASTFDDTAWTINASLNNKSTSATIVINSAKEYSMLMEYKLYFIKGNPIDLCTSVTGGWSAAAIICGSASYPQTRNGMNPTINTSGTYFVVSCGHDWKGNNFYDGCIRTTNLTHDLTGRSKIIINYDITLSGTYNQYYGIAVRLFASKTKITSNQTQATNAINTNYTSHASNQTKTLTISSTGGYVEIGIGINQYYNPGTIGTVTIKSLYAE